MVQRDYPADAEPVVIPCPEPGTKGNVGELTSSNTSSPLTSIDTTETFESGPLIPESRPGSQQLTKIDPAMMLTQVQESMPGAEVSLSQKTKGGIQTTKIITMPRSAQFDGVVHTALPPRSDEDMFKVSVDMDRRRHYSLIEPSDNAQASVIERHPAFVSTSSSRRPTISALAPGTARYAADGLDYGLEWKECPVDVPVEKKSGDSNSPETLHPPFINVGELGQSTIKSEQVYGVFKQYRLEAEPSLLALPPPSPPTASSIVSAIVNAPLAALSWIVPKRR